MRTVWNAADEMVEIRVPASIANLGPGFDTLAVAVKLYLRLRVRRNPGAKSGLEFNFVNRKLEGENYIERAFQFLARQNAAVELPSLTIEVDSEIPMRSGLGSSAAATVAGIRLYEAVAGPIPQQAALNVACILEGHPDNAAAALLGGMTGSCQLPDGSAYAFSFPWPEALKIVVVTPAVPLETHISRGVLPQRFTRADAVFNLQRVVLLIHALQNENYSILREALSDRWHQPYRQRLVPGLRKALELDHPDVLGVCLCGAGPSVAAFACGNVNAVEELMAGIYEREGVGYQLRTLDVHQAAVQEVPYTLPVIG